jgi:hypothetical protein
MVSASSFLPSAKTRKNHFAWLMSIHKDHFRRPALALMHFYHRKISGIFTESYANAVYEIFLEVNNRLRDGKLGEARKPGEHGCRNLGGSSLNGSLVQASVRILGHAIAFYEAHGLDVTERILRCGRQRTLRIFLFTAQNRVGRRVALAAGPSTCWQEQRSQPYPQTAKASLIRFIGVRQH